jgi:1,2-dihydroxy-3-keto-5-methylthiopentene dioxygenase
MKLAWLTPRDPPLDAVELVRAGVVCERLPPDPEVREARLDALMRDRGYAARDEVALRPDTPGLAELEAKFAAEHHHDDDEVRFVLEGEGVFDLRNRDDAWMRLRVEPGDLVVVPAQLHHRFFLTSARTIRCVRLFKDAQGWVPHYRTSPPESTTWTEPCAPTITK